METLRVGHGLRLGDLATLAPTKIAVSADASDTSTHKRTRWFSSTAMPKLVEIAAGTEHSIRIKCWKSYRINEEQESWGGPNKKPEHRTE